MLTELDIAKVLTDAATRRALRQVVNSRSIHFGDLVKRMGADRAQVKDSLVRLKDLGLIDEHASILEDFSSFFVTAEGLRVGRRLSSIDE